LHKGPPFIFLFSLKCQLYACNSQHTCIAESERPSSRSTQNVPSRISRVISHAVSNILPSSSGQQSNQATGNPPPSCNNPYNSAAGTIPASGLSSILSARVACEPTPPDALLHARQLTVSAPGASSSRVTDGQRSVHKETPPNPILRTNLLTTTPTFKDGGFTAPRVTRNYSRNPAFSTGTSTSVDSASRNPIPTVNYSCKDKRYTSTRSARNSAAPSPVSGHSKAATGSSGGIISRTGPILRPTPLILDSVTGVASSQATDNFNLVNFTSDQPSPPNTVHRVSANKSLTNSSCSDLKGSYNSSIVSLWFLSSLISY
jgi:hypothetical protein